MSSFIFSIHLLIFKYSLILSFSYIIKRNIETSLFGQKQKDLEFNFFELLIFFNGKILCSLQKTKKQKQIKIILK